MGRKATIGEQFVELARRVLDDEGPLSDENPEVYNELFFSKRGEMIRSASDAEIEDIARNMVIAFPWLAADIRSVGYENAIHFFTQKRSALKGG
jgi:hypothetical protein